MGLRRLLFASIHSYVDPSSGAALATRDLLELLVERGVDCRALTAGVLDYEHETSLESVLQAMGASCQPQETFQPLRSSARVLDLVLSKVRVTLLPLESSRADRSPSLKESEVFLGLVEQALHRFQPEVLLTYGGHPANLELIKLSRRLGIPVVFHLHNFAYEDRRGFDHVNQILVPSRYSAKHYGKRLGLDCTVIPYPLRLDRVVVQQDPQEARFLTFVNPQPSKGVTVFARIALELQQRRPEIPLLVVEGRGNADWLEQVDLDLSGLKNLHRMKNTSNPQDFYKVSKAILMPSLWKESFGRVAAEALANGLPVLASDRGALPEILGDAGFIFSLPESCQTHERQAPSAREIEPWLTTIERIWDDPGWQEDQSRRGLQESQRWNPELLIDQYRQFFEDVKAKTD